jgi:hypothetical protein
MSKQTIKYTSVDSISIAFDRAEILRMLEAEARRRWSIGKEFTLDNQDVYYELTDEDGKEIELNLEFKHSVERKENITQLDGHNI